jgi:hypothetical protein
MTKTTGDTSPGALGRRGIFAAGWAAIAGLILSKTTQPVQAAAPLQFQDIAGGGFATNSAGGPSLLFSNSSFTSITAPLVGMSFEGSARAGLAGTYGSGTPVASVPCGVHGTQTKSIGGFTAGVLGDNLGTLAVGVLGRSGINPDNLNDGVGVLGESGGGIGVRGVIRGAKNAIALSGENSSTYTGAAPGAGGFGVYGASANGHGLVGATGTAGGAAVVGATNSVAGAFAGAFYGPVVVSGAFTVFGPKSAAVPHPDGSHRLLYCVESPESWFEDFGKGELDCGKADVAIDPNFAAVVDLSDYHVFVTMYDQPQLLTVSNRTPTGFRVAVHESKAAARSRGESWRSGRTSSASGWRRSRCRRNYDCRSSVVAVASSPR